jgi:hypothetical protein
MHSSSTHCKENPNHAQPKKKLRGLNPNFHIHVSVSDLLYTPLFISAGRKNVLVGHVTKTLSCIFYVLKGMANEKVGVPGRGRLLGIGLRQW